MGVVLYTHSGDNTINYLEATKMTTNEILDVLAENESKLFYAFCRDPKNEGLKIAHESAKKALEDYAKSTGII